MDKPLFVKKGGGFVTLRQAVEMQRQQAESIVDSLLEAREIISAAAIRFPDGSVFDGVAHFDALVNAFEAGKFGDLPWDNIRDIYADQQGYTDGYLTNLGRFIDREEAAQIALANNQVKQGSTALTHGFLDAEDLLSRVRQESVAVDLDGTLARDSGWKGPEHIGEPVKPMLDLVKKLLDDGEDVVIFTARVHDGEKSTKEHIKQWLKDNDLPDLEITNEKRPDMEKFYDDKAVAVEKNKGVSESKRDLISTMKQIVDVWSQEDWDWVSDGCADVTFALWSIGRKLGWPVKPVTGTAETNNENTFPHAWLDVGGSIFDPVAYANGYKVKRYHPSAGDHVQHLRDIFGVEADENYGYTPEADIERFKLLADASGVNEALLLESPTLKTLQKNKVDLEPDERKQIMKAKAVWPFGKKGADSPAVHKAVVKGKPWYWSSTHRLYHVDSTVAAAIKNFFKIVEPSG